MHSSMITLSEEYKVELKWYNYVTPTTYIELISLFKKKLLEQKTHVSDWKQGY